MDLLWDGDLASDGTRIEPDGGGFAVSLAAGGVIRLCPCCDKPFAKREFARAFVNKVHRRYPAAAIALEVMAESEAAGTAAPRTERR
jgi:hypothetical protein